jgi:hypothetical protein
MSVVRSTLVIAAVTLLATPGCHAPRATRRPAPSPSLSRATYTSTMVDIRTTLGRALIGIETRGVAREIRSSTCNATSCMRCELAGLSDAPGAMPDEVIDPATLRAIKVAFDRYPSDVLEASKIRRVALCRQLVDEAGTPVAGAADLVGHRMFINLAGFFGRPYDLDDAPTAADIVHHELYHLFEFAVMSDIAIDDVAWRAQNPAGFRYAKAEAGARRPFGFVNAYATTNDYEDRASVFELLMARPETLCEMAKDDSIVREKTRLVWERTAIVTGEAFLRQRAPCVTWIAPRTPRVLPARPYVKPVLRGAPAPAWLERPSRAR